MFLFARIFIFSVTLLGAINLIASVPAISSTGQAINNALREVILSGNIAEAVDQLTTHKFDTIKSENGDLVGLSRGKTLVVLKPSEMNRFKSEDFSTLYIHFDDTVGNVAQFIEQMPKSVKPQAIILFDDAEKRNLSIEDVNSILLSNVGRLEIFSNRWRYECYTLHIETALWVAEARSQGMPGTYNRLTVTKTADDTELLTPATLSGRCRGGAACDNGAHCRGGPRCRGGASSQNNSASAPRDY